MKTNWHETSPGGRTRLGGDFRIPLFLLLAVLLVTTAALAQTPQDSGQSAQAEQSTLTAPPSPQPPAPIPSRESWMGVYLQGQKIGYLKTVLTRIQYEGKDAYRLESVIHTKMLLLSAEIQQDISIILYTDLAMNPIFEDFIMSSGGQNSRVQATFKPDVIECKLTGMGASGATTKKDVPIPPSVTLVGDPTVYGTSGKKLQVGDKLSMHTFNPLTIAIEAVNIEVTGKEVLVIRGKTYDTLIVKSLMPMGEMTTWQDESGDSVKILGIMGMTMLRETREEAMGDESGGYQPPKDLAVLTSVKADTDIREPAKVAKLKVRITGISSEKLIVNDSRQQVTWSKKEDVCSADFVISAGKNNGKDSAFLPMKSDSLKPLLADVPYIQADNPAIQRQAKLIVGKEKRAFQAASKIRRWVHDNMKMQADIGIVRSALDVYNNRVGVCRDYALLYTALARAAGIPTRVAAGLVFFNGSFYYHAWAESYTGQWTSFDATLSTDFVDATHIKLTNGDATSMFEISTVIGGLNAQILEYQYLGK